MKIKAKQYAISLFESLKNKEDKEQKEVISNFSELLIENNDISKLEEVLGCFNSLWNEYEGITEVEIISARKIDKKLMISLEEFVSKKSKSKKNIITEKEDESIIGGVILRYGDKSLDLSIKEKLNKFKEQLIS